MVDWTLTISTGTGGTTSPAPGDSVAAVGATITVTAVPDPGHVLAGWIFDGIYAGVVNPKIAGDFGFSTRTLQALFTTTADTWDVNIQSATGGSTSPSGVQNVAVGLSLVVTASMNSNYDLTGWILDGVTIAPTNPLTIPTGTAAQNKVLLPIFTYTTPINTSQWLKKYSFWTASGQHFPYQTFDALIDVATGVTQYGIIKGSYAYLIWLNGSDCEAISGNGQLAFGGENDAGGADGADFDLVLTTAFADAAANGGKVYIKSGDYGVITVDVPDGVDLEIEQGVNTTLVFSYAADYSGIVLDYRTNQMFFGRGGAQYSFGVVKQVAPSVIYNNILLRAKATNDMTLLQLSPNGTGYTSGPSTWTSSLQLANTDVAADSVNFEIMEMTWENNYAYINVYHNGTGNKRTFAILLEAEHVQIYGHGATGTYGLNGQFFSEFFHPVKFDTYTSGTWAAPISLVATTADSGHGGASDPCTTPAMICYIPQATVLPLGWSQFHIFNTQLSGNGCATVISSPGSGAENPLQYHISNMAIDASWSVANELVVSVYANNAGGAYTTQGPITVYIELRY